MTRLSLHVTFSSEIYYLYILEPILVSLGILDNSCGRGPSDKFSEDILELQASLYTVEDSYTIHTNFRVTIQPKLNQPKLNATVYKILIDE